MRNGRPHLLDTKYNELHGDKLRCTAAHHAQRRDQPRRRGVLALPRVRRGNIGWGSPRNKRQRGRDKKASSRQPSGDQARHAPRQLRAAGADAPGTTRRGKGGDDRLQQALRAPSPIPRRRHSAGSKCQPAIPTFYVAASGSGDTTRCSGPSTRDATGAVISIEPGT